jgi:hypothetical protein
MVSSSPAGALAAQSYHPIMLNLIFSANAASSGAGIYNDESSCLTLVNVLLIDNTASQTGGGLYNRQSGCLVLKNLTILNNSAVTAGGGLYNDNAQAQVHNTIVWGNTSPNGAQVANSSSLRPDFSYCDIQGSGGSGGGWSTALGQDGGGNIDAAPLFINIAQRQLGLLPHSPARNAGLDALINPIAIDLSGGPRILDGRVDMGAYEQLWLQLFLPAMVR